MRVHKNICSVFADVLVELRGNPRKMREILENSCKFLKISKKHVKFVQNLDRGTKMEPKWMPKLPKWSQKASKGSQMEPKWSQNGAHGAQREPKGSQMEPKGCQKGAKGRPKCNRKSMSVKGREKVLRGACGNKFWSHFGQKSIQNASQNRCTNLCRKKR